MRRVRGKVTAIVVAGILVVGACGDDDSDAGGSADEADASGTAEETPDTGDDTADDDTATEEGAEAGDAADDTAAESDDSFCEQAESIYRELTGPNSLDEEHVASLLDTMDDVEPPEAVAEDWEATVDGLRTLSEGDIEDPDVNDPQVAAALERAVGAFDNIASYLRDDCGVDLTQ